MKSLTSATIVPEITNQLTECYMNTQQQLAEDPSQPSQIWEESLTRLRNINFRSITPAQFAEANSFVTLLQQCLVAKAGQVPFDGEQPPQ